MGLTKESCIPCQGGIDPLSPEAAQTMLKNIPEWEIIDNNTKLFRRFTFSNFKKSLALVNAIGDIAESEKHHPDINFGWGYCEVTLQTHAINGLHKNDFIVAAKINELDSQ